MEVLVDAKKEYLNQLAIIMVPFMIETFQDVYNESVNRSKNKKVLAMNQLLLKDVKVWNDNIIKQHNDEIIHSCSWFNELVAAVFVSHIKILSTVKLSAESNKISVKLPTNERFIHACYVAAAKDLYKDPYIFHEEADEFVRDEKLFERFNVCISATVKELIPIQDILRVNMTKDDIKSLDLNNTDDGFEPEIEEGPEEPEFEEGSEPQPEPSSEPPETAALDAGDPEVEEVKSISVEGKGAPAEQLGPEESLFDDAPESIKKP
tara:strand:+ start:4622 stop:5413 length:792 start_codon:yes stop_codon:yes gene_type:complete